MTARTRKRSAGRATTALEAQPPPGGSIDAMLWRAQRAWWGVGTVGALVALLGFQTLSPSRRLAHLERADARQDSLIAARAMAQGAALDTIRRQLGQLLAGQCAKERDRMARLLYGCR